jgi:hypothetical protein
MLYWNKEGKYSEILNRAWDEFVADSGEAETEIGELVRSFGRINYDLFNNGAGNMFDSGPIEEVWDDENQEENWEIKGLDSMFQGFFENLLEATNDPELIGALERECRIVCETGNFNKKDWVIDKVGDVVGEIVENYYVNNDEQTTL